MEQQITEERVMNFLEDEDYDAPATTTAGTDSAIVEPLSYDLDQIEFATESVEEQPKIQRAKLPSGSRITEGNAELIYFLSKFPGATSEALSIITTRKDRASAGLNLLPTVKGTEKRLRKLERLGAIEAVKNPFTGTVHYTATQVGIDALWTFGYNAEYGATLDKKAPSRLLHYANIALVGAQFASPHGYFRDSLGIEPVSIDDLISENQMRAEYEPIKLALKEAGKKGDSSDYGKWRKGELDAALAEAGSGRIHWSDVVAAHPTLLTLGQPRRTGAKSKPVHQSDLAVILDSTRDGVKARNLLVEVELSKKSWAEYDSILKTFSMEFEHGFIYERGIYFTAGPQVETLLRKVDAAGKYGLFASGKLAVFPILDRYENPVRINNRISLGGL